MIFSDALRDLKCPYFRWLVELYIILLFVLTITPEPPLPHNHVCNIVLCPTSHPVLVYKILHHISYQMTNFTYKY